MLDDKSERDLRDRSKVAAGDGYEVKYFAEKHRISTAKAAELIRKHGNERAKLDAAADLFKGDT